MKAYTYILRCSDDSLYTGWTTNLEKRIKDHNSNSKGAKYTKVRRPCELVYHETFEDDEESSAKQKAMSREWHIKHDLTKAEKEKLIRQEK